MGLLLRQTGQLRGEKGGGELGIPKSCLSMRKVFSTLLIWMREEQRRVMLSKSDMASFSVSARFATLSRVCGWRLWENAMPFLFFSDPLKMWLMRLIV